ncbi:MAG: hypothetical protein OHK0021_12690 [Bryobacter sp.]
MLRFRNLLKLNYSVKFRDLINLLESDGWQLVRQKGSQQQFKHSEKLGIITVAGQGGRDVPSGTCHKIRKDAGIKPLPDPNSSKEE